MQFLYILTLNAQYRNESNWTEEANTAQGAHFNYLKKLFEEGVMKQVGLTDLPLSHDDLHGYAIFEAENEAAAKDIMDNDPAIKGGIMTAKLLPYRVVFIQGIK